MSNRKPPTRFVVEIDGHFKRLFTVREVKQGTIILTTHSGSVEPRDRSWIEVLNSKHTIHPSGSSASNANMVHLTTNYADGTKRELHLLTHAARDGCFQPIYSRTVIDPRLTPDLVHHDKGKIVNLDSYNPATASMHYTIWLSSAEAADNFPLHPAYSTAVCSFSLFSLNVAWGFTSAPSKARGVLIHFMSASEERITEQERSLDYRIGITPGVEPLETVKCVIHELNHVIEGDARSPLASPLVRQQWNPLSRPPSFTPAPPHD